MSTQIEVRQTCNLEAEPHAHMKAYTYACLIKWLDGERGRFSRNTRSWRRMKGKNVGERSMQGLHVRENQCRLRENVNIYAKENGNLRGLSVSPGLQEQTVPLALVKVPLYRYGNSSAKHYYYMSRRQWWRQLPTAFIIIIWDEIPDSLRGFLLPTSFKVVFSIQRPKR